MTRQIPYPHPGEILAEEFLKPMEITPYRLAKEIHVPLTRIAAILAGKRAVTVDTALRLSRYFGTSEGFWSGLQTDYDTAILKETLAKELAAITTYNDERFALAA
jgi:addiction module HigA family antidote